MSNKRPNTVPELIEFYYQVFKPLYAHMQVINKPPLEMFFELNAVFDHLSRYWHYGESEEQAVYHAAAHLKRACFDAFKIVYRETWKHYKELRRIDTSIIDNGKFDSELIHTFQKIRLQAIEARKTEGNSRDEAIWYKAFDIWYEVYGNCVAFDREFYFSENVEWARKKQTKSNWFRRTEGFVLGLIVSFIYNPLKTFFVWFLKTLFGSQ